MQNKPSRTTFHIRLEAMVQQLRADIRSGKLAAGTYLPSEEVLGRQFLLSKNSVRKGLAALVEEKIIVKKPKVGNMVTSPDAGKEKVVIRFCYYSTAEHETGISTLLDNFEQNYPHIQVKRLNIHFNQYPEQAMEFMKDNMVDVVMLNYGTFRYFYNNHALHLLAEQVADSRIYPFLNQAFTVDNTQYVKPFVFSPVILCYNKKHFDEAGLPEPDSSWTWNDFSQAVTRLADATPSRKRFGFHFHLLSENRWPLWFLQTGFSLQKNHDGAYSLQNAVFMKSMNLVKDLLTRQQEIASFTSESDLDTERLFAEEKTSMILTTYFNLNNLKDVPFTYNISPLPYTTSPLTLLLNIGLAASNLSSHKDEAQLLIDFLTSKEAQEQIRNDTLSLPSMKEVAEQVPAQPKNEPSRFQMFREIIPTFRYYTAMNVESHQLNQMIYHLKLYWSNMDSLANVVTGIEQALNE